MLPILSDGALVDAEVFYQRLNQILADARITLWSPGGNLVNFSGGDVANNPVTSIPNVWPFGKPVDEFTYWRFAGVGNHASQYRPVLDQQQQAAHQQQQPQRHPLQIVNLSTNGGKQSIDGNRITDPANNDPAPMRIVVPSSSSDPRGSNRAAQLNQRAKQPEQRKPIHPPGDSVLNFQSDGSYANTQIQWIDNEKVIIGNKIYSIQDGYIHVDGKRTTIKDSSTSLG